MVYAQKAADGRGLYLVFKSSFFWRRGYKGGGQIWKNREMNGIGVCDVKFPKIQ